MGKLAELVRQKDPDSYRDWSDEDIEVAFLQKYPTSTKYKELADPQSRTRVGGEAAQRAQNAPAPPPLTNSDVISSIAPTGAPVVDAPFRGLARAVDYVRESPVGTAIGAAHEAIEVPYQGLGMLADMVLTGGKNIKLGGPAEGITGSFTGGAQLEKQLPQQLIETLKKEALGTAGFTTGAPGAVLPGDEPHIRESFAKTSPVVAGTEGVANKAAQLGVQMVTDPAMLALGPMAKAGGAPLAGMVGPQALTAADKASRAAAAGLGASFAGPMLAGAGEQAGESMAAAEQGDIASAIENAGGAVIDAAFAAHVGKGIRKSVPDIVESAKSAVSDFQAKRKAAAASKPVAADSEAKDEGVLATLSKDKYKTLGQIGGVSAGAAAGSLIGHPLVGAIIGERLGSRAGKAFDVKAEKARAARKANAENKPDGAVGAVDPNMSTTGTKPAEKVEAPLAQFVKPEEAKKAEAPKASSTGTTPYYVEPNLRINVPEGAKAGVEEAIAGERKPRQMEFSYDKEVAPKVEGDETGHEEPVKQQEPKHEFNAQSVGVEADRTGSRKTVEEGAKGEAKGTESPKNAMEALFATQKEKVGGELPVEIPTEEPGATVEEQFAGVKEGEKGKLPIEVPRKVGGSAEEQMAKQQKLGEQAKAKQAKREAVPGYNEAKAAREASPEFQERVNNPDLVKQFDNPKQRRAIVHNQMEAEAKAKAKANPEAAKSARGEAFTALDNLQQMTKGKEAPKPQPDVMEQLKASLEATKKAPSAPAVTKAEAPAAPEPPKVETKAPEATRAVKPAEKGPLVSRSVGSLLAEGKIKEAATLARHLSSAKPDATVEGGRYNGLKVGDVGQDGKMVIDIDEGVPTVQAPRRTGNLSRGGLLQRTMAEGMAEAKEATPPMREGATKVAPAVREAARMKREARHQGMLFEEPETETKSGLLERKVAGGISRLDQFPSVEAWWQHHKELGFEDAELLDAIKEGGGGEMLERKSPAIPKEPVDTVAARQNEAAERNSKSIKEVQKQLKNSDISSLPEDEQVKRMADQGEKEVLYQRNQIRSGEKWYNKDIKAMEGALSQEEPSLANPDNMSIFKLIAATTSFGNRPNPNIEIALTIYRELKNQGRLATKQESGKHWSGSPVFAESAPKIDALVEAKGWKGAVEWLMAKHPVSEIREWNKNVAGKASDVKFGSEALGPKGSPFFQNLMGNYSQTTADMWYSRTFNRWRGTKMEDAPRNGAELALMRKVNDEIARRTGVDPADTQAMLWFHEKALYGKLGAKEDFGSYAVAGRRAAESLRAGKTEVSAKSPVKPEMRSVAMEVKFGSDSPYSKKYDWNSLTPEQARQVTNEHGRNLIDTIEAETGARVVRAEPSTGIYASYANPNWIVKMHGTPEQLHAAAHMFGLGAQQESVVASRPAADPAEANPGLEASGGKGWEKAGFLEKVWDEYSKRVPKLAEDGGASLEFGENGQTSIRLFGQAFRYSPTKLAEASKALREAIVAAGEKNPKIANKNFDVTWASNDWAKAADGASYKKALKGLGYTEETINSFVEGADKSIERAWNNATKGDGTLKRLVPAGEVTIKGSTGDYKVPGYDSGIPEIAITRTIGRESRLTLTHKPTGFALVSNIPNTEGNQIRLREFAQQVANISGDKLSGQMKDLSADQQADLAQLASDFRSQFTSKKQAFSRLNQIRNSITDQIKAQMKAYAEESQQLRKIKTGEESRAEARKDPVGYVIDSTVNYLFDNMQRVAEKTKIGAHFGPRTPALEAYQGKYINKPLSQGGMSGGRKPVWHQTLDNEGQLYVGRTANIREAAQKLAGMEYRKMRTILREAKNGDTKVLEELSNKYKEVLQETIAHEMLHSFRDTVDSTDAMQRAMNLSANELLDTPTENGKTLRQELEQYWNTKSVQEGFKKEVKDQAEDALHAYETNTKGSTNIPLKRVSPEALAKSEGPRPVQASIGGMLQHASEVKRRVGKPAKGVIYQKSKFTQPRLAPKTEAPLAGMIKR